MQTVIARVLSNTSTPVIDWHGGDGTFFADGSFASGALTLDASIDGGLTFQPCKDAGDANLSLSADGIISFSVGPCKLRASMAGSTVAVGTAQVETVTFSGASATPASATLAVFAIPVAGDKIFFTSPAGVQKVLTFVAGAANANEISLVGLVFPSAVINEIVSRPPGGLNLTNTSSGGTFELFLFASTAGAAGNGWAVETVGAWAQRIAVTSNGRDAGTLTAGGLMNVTVTAAGMAGSPLLVPVRVEAGDALAVWSEKVRNTLRLRPEVSALFAVGGTGAAVTLTRLSPFAANDTTLNIALAAGSPVQTPVTTSANTTAGVVTAPNVLVSVQKR